MGGRLLLFSTVLAILVNFCYAEPVGTCPEENEQYATYLTDSEDCRIFYECNWGVAYKYICPDDLYFNPLLDVCDYPEQTDCGSPSGESTTEGGVDVTESSTENIDDGSSAVGECPADNSGDVVHLPHESDCSLFYKCDWGVPVLQECDDGLHFNPTLEVCDWPASAGCDGGSGDNGGDNGNDGDDDGTGDEDVESEETDENDGDDEDDGNSAVGECPADNSGNAVHLPHESDCSLFYKCDWGVPILQECPPELHFNPILEVCDWPASAGCDSGSGDNGGDNGNDGDDDGTGDEDVESEETDENDGDDEDDGNSAVGECPADNSGNAVHLPHESDCSLFYKCDWGVPILQECPPELHFNPILEVCDWPANAGCEGESGDNGGDNGNDGDDDGTGDEDVESEETDENGEDDEEDNGNSAVGECPADNSGNAVHLPHESDCSLFYKCDWGVPILQECPPELHFNPVLEVCDWPASAGCDSGSGDNGGDNGNDGDDDGTDDEDVESEETDENDGDDGEDDGNSAVGECPADNSGNAVHLPHESDCSLFYKCDWGVPILQECPPELHFNPILEVCDWPANAGCEGESGDNGGDNGNDGDDDGTGDEDVESEETDENDEDDGEDDGNSAVGECPADNSGNAVHLPHESDCSLFYKCDWGVPILQECPPELHFNPILEVCDWPANAGCEGESGDNGGDNGNDGDDNGTDDEDVESEETDENDGDDEDDGNSAVGECPADNSGNAVHLPHESDCSLFYKCDWGVPILQECPPELHFNPVLEVCDWPASAGCDSGSGDNGGDNGNDGDDDGTDDEDVESEETDENDGDDGEDDGNSPVGECPADNSGNAVHLPHESDCSLFYKCDWGVPILQECPPELHFNPILEVCDWPASAGCDSGSGDNGGDNGNDDGTGDEDVESEETDENDGDDEEDDGNSAVGECPADNSGNAVHLPHESDCSLFYKCDWGVPILQECPPELHFNPILEVCDWPASAGCDSGSGDNGGDNGNDGDDDGTGDEDVESEETDENDGDDEDDGNSAVGECPADNSGNAVHLPHESDCSLFYKCDWGVPILQECPPELHFNPILEVCDWPASAGCDSGLGDNGEDNGNDNDGTGDDVESEETDENDGDDGEDDGNSAVGECPADNSGNAVHLPHESDCSLFYKCDWGVPILQECPPELHFNPILEVCDWPASAGCDSGSGDNGGDNGNDDGTGDEDVESEETDENDEDDEEDDGNSAVGECPADNSGNAVHLPHESDCSLFYKCDWGVPILQECPPELHFNPVLEVCDWPASAGCDSGSGDNGGDNGNDGDDGGTDDEDVESEETDENDGDDGEDDGNSAVGECPVDNSGNAVHLPHESDCSLFYKCDWGVPILQECPPELHFNPTLEVCDWPANAGCESGSGDNGEDNGDGDDSGDDGNSEDGGGGDDGDDNDGSDTDNGDGLGFCNTVSCPAENEDYVTFIPNASDCTRFCKCNWGLAYEFICPDGLYFNPTLNVCDNPQDSGCTM